MKPITLFYLENCPHCKKARKILDEMLQKPQYEGLSVQMIEESREPELANQYDYYYVPTFYVGEKKIHEGVLGEKEIREVLELARS